MHVAGITAKPDGAWVVQCGRQLTDSVDGFLVAKRFLLHDRDPLFTATFREDPRRRRCRDRPTSAEIANLNAFAERFVRSIKESCLDRLILSAKPHYGEPFASSSRIITKNGIIKDSATC